jgi:hypothetical protein
LEADVSEGKESEVREREKETTSPYIVSNPLEAGATCESIDDRRSVNMFETNSIEYVVMNERIKQGAS